MKIDFAHRQSAHCESGVCSNLLHHYGINISEAMAFGMGSGMFFGYLPFIRINRLPLTTYRCEMGVSSSASPSGWDAGCTGRNSGARKRLWRCWMNG